MTAAQQWREPPAGFDLGKLLTQIKVHQNAGLTPRHSRVSYNWGWAARI